MQAVSSEHKDFGQPVVSSNQPGIEGAHDGLLTPAQAAACFHIPEYQLRRACAEGRLKHRRVVNAFWISPVAVAAFARGPDGQERAELVMAAEDRPMRRAGSADRRTPGA